MSTQSGPNSGGDLFDMAKDGTTVPEDSAKPRTIPSKPRPDQIVSADDPNSIGGTTMAEAATNAGDIPRTTTDTVSSEVLTGTGDAMPPSTDSKRLHNVPRGVVNDPNAKGSTRYEQHIKQKGGDVEHGASEGAQVEKAPGDEDLTDEQAMDKIERKEVS